MSLCTSDKKIKTATAVTIIYRKHACSSRVWHIAKYILKLRRRYMQNNIISVCIDYSFELFIKPIKELPNENIIL